MKYVLQADWCLAFQRPVVKLGFHANAYDLMLLSKIACLVFVPTESAVPAKTLVCIFKLDLFYSDKSLLLLSLH